jgi:hypothetical protein
VKAQETALISLLEPKRQYYVPLYQRRYAWTRSEWEQFWVGLRRQYRLVQSGETADRAAHFFGSFVVQPTGDQASRLSRYASIDGQQRFTTVSLFLAALRDLWPDAGEGDRLTEEYLVNKHEAGDDHYKLRLGPYDRSDMEAIVSGDDTKATGLVGAAYRWLRNAIEVEAAESGGLEFGKFEVAAVKRLEVVDITTSATDNAHRIFQTLNSTGRKLTQVDLLRNHFFMLLPTLGDEAYTLLWEPMERRLGERLDLFLWVDLVGRGGGHETIGRDGVYQAWQQDLESIEHSEDAVFKALNILRTRAEAYEKIIDPSLISDKPLRRQLELLNEWGATVHHPVLLPAMVLLDEGKLEPGDVAEAAAYIESFLVRRLFARIPTNNLNRIFTTTAGQVPLSSAYSSDLRRSLSSAGKYWPSDVDLRAAILHEGFYLAQRPAQRQYALRRLEETFPGKERPDWTSCNFSVEHVMPQHLSPEWHEALERTGEADPVAAHAELVHTLGNLTLSCDNPSLSDSPIQRKQQIYEGSMLRMNKALVAVDSWGRAEIDDRGELLAKLAIKRWPGPVVVPTTELEAEEELVGEALKRLPEGRWTTLVDLAEVANLSPDAVRAYVLGNPKLPREAVLRQDGTPDPSLPWVLTDIAGYRQTLVGLGILDDATDPAAPAARRVTDEELATLLGDG